jgi:pterin-4a-carbinolamine dehydratase
MTMTPLAFISYRRQDSSPYALLIAQTLRQAFGDTCVFLDYDDIRVGNRFTQDIEAALGKATVLLPIIGPNWVTLAGKWGQRRLDSPADWVRIEIKTSLGRGLPVVPLLVARAEMPPPEALPEEIAPFSECRFLSVRDENFQSDLEGLLRELQRDGFRRLDRPITYPPPVLTSLKRLSEQEMEAGLARLPGWEALAPAGQNDARMIEKTYQFASFEEAIEFMQIVSRHVSRIEHHPSWENIWRSVRVRLTTFDIGNQISQLDLDLAAYMDEIAASCPSQRPRGSVPPASARAASAS